MKDGSRVGAFALAVEDVTGLGIGGERLVSHAVTCDPLTGLLNRMAFGARLDRALSRAKRAGKSVAVLFLDLDGFKLVNDSMGHEAGDTLLAAVAGRLRDVLRPEDVATRLAGDEFAVLLRDTTRAGATCVAERILEALRRPVVLDGREVVVTASVGIALSTVRKGSRELLDNADLAMYRAKHAGKSRHVVFEEAMIAQALRRLEMRSELARALERKELAVHYQPQVELATDRVAVMEALVRWEHPVWGRCLPTSSSRWPRRRGLSSLWDGGCSENHASGRECGARWSFRSRPRTWA